MEKDSSMVEATPVNLPEIPELPKDAPLIIGVLALQGAFKEHLVHLRRIQTTRPLTAIAVRTSSELLQCQALIIPGGESTSISLIASRQIDSSNHSFLDWLKSFSQHRFVWGTCAGLILLSDQLVAEGTKTGGQEILGGLPVRTTRNQWGRQTESFEQLIEIPFIKDPEILFPAIFIRAPMIHTILETPAEDSQKQQQPLKIIAQLPPDSFSSRLDTTDQQSLGPDSHVVAVKFQHLFATSFHPELSPDTRLHQFWVNECVLNSF
ncbi:hypothetical protein MJO29_015004 [Puccinia striiformis f. sp. tritici]|uniref:glutaminase n=1 Tax=Puccinia striiformis f. sp. tritici PST-78 TaxID=1165861 RepID=A0A0L0VVF2_9BASI|nr:hypothetical protein Pst134EB_028590 [Puccinia striiformis f. sp. tritici]KAI7937689.1 hypothetical protein MJO29_015004 [Puccinia striiformis f. sp. tritici]KNF03251.1 hypothetical protein PSTG_03515 [Puccinia striiformis f. sp. tritici PST-78]